MKVQLDYLSKSAAVLVLMLAAASAMAGNLLKNGGFEELSAKTKFPSLWVKSSSYKGDISVLAGAAEAHSGTHAVKVGSIKGDAALIFIRDFRLGADRELSTTLWAKGNGSFIVFYYFYGQKGFLSSIRTKGIAVKSDKWQKYEVSNVIPAEFGAKKEKVRWFKFALHVRKGVVSFDDIELKVVSGAQKK